MTSPPQRRRFSATALAALAVACPVEARTEIDSLALARGAIFKIIEADLARKGIEAGAQFDPEELIIQSSLPPAMSGARLAIKRVAWDPYRRKIIFEIWAPEVPAIPPVEIAVRNRAQWIENYAAELAVASESFSTSSPTPAPPHAQPKPAILAKPGTPAVLTLSSENVCITMEVLPLQRGSAGQTIFVRDTATGRVLKAEVDGENALRASF